MRFALEIRCKSRSAGGRLGREFAEEELRPEGVARPRLCPARTQVGYIGDILEPLQAQRPAGGILEPLARAGGSFIVPNFPG